MHRNPDRPDVLWDAVALATPWLSMWVVGWLADRFSEPVSSWIISGVLFLGLPLGLLAAAIYWLRAKSVRDINLGACWMTGIVIFVVGSWVMDVILLNMQNSAHMPLQQ